MKYIYILLYLVTISLLGNVKFGYVPSGMNEFVMTKYKGQIMSEYFNKKTKEGITVLKFNSFNSLKAAITSKSIDIALIPNYKYRTFAKVTTAIVNISKTGKKLASYMVITNKASNITSTKDLKGKILACSGNRGNISFLGSIIKKHPEDEFSKIIKERSPSKLLKKLVTNQADVTCVNEGVYNSIIKYRPSYKNKLKILYKSKKYASDLIVASKKLSSSKVKGMRKLLLDMKSDPEGGQVLVSLKIIRFISPISGEKNYPVLNIYKKNKKTEEKEEKEEKSNKTKKKKRKRKKEYNSAKTKNKTVEPKEDIKNEELKKIRLENESLQKELSEKKKKEEKAKIIAKIREEEQKKAESRVKPRIIQISKAEKPNIQDNSSMLLYIVLGLFVIIVFIIIIIIRNMKKQNKEFHNQGELINDFYGEGGVQTMFNVDMPEFTNSKVTGASIVRIALQGELNDLYIARIFKQLMEQEKTGILTLTMEGASPQIIEVLFNQGKVNTALCKTGAFQTKLKNQILKEAPNLKEKIEVIFNNSLNNQERFCILLRKENIIEKDKLDSLALLQAKEIILSIFLWKTGKYEFKEIIEEDLDFDEGSKLQLDVTSLVQEGINRYKEWRYISKIIAKASYKVKFIDGKYAELITSISNKNLLEVADLIDGERSIRDIGNISRFSDFKILKLIARLKEKGYLEFSEY